MSDCLSIVDTHTDLSLAAQWANINQIPAINLLHTESLANVCASSGNLEFDTFCIPDIDCRIIGALIYHNCETGAIASWDDDPISHVSQTEDGACITPCGWTLSPKSYTGEADLCWITDPCKRLEDYRKCQEKIKAGLVKKSFSWRDSSGSTRMMSEEWLRDEIRLADLACDAKCGLNTRCVSYRCNNGYC